jgi:uncharacterized protein
VEEPDEDVIAFAARVYDYARTGSTAKLVDLIVGGIAVDMMNEVGDTLLMLAAYHGHLGTVRALLVFGADPNIVNDRGQTPVAGAVFKGDEAIVQVLLESGADPDAGSPSAVATAAMFGRESIAALFEQRAS